MLKCFLKLITFFLVPFFSFCQNPLEGTVVDSANNSVERATIQIRTVLHNNLLKTYLTDANGKFTFFIGSKMEADSYKIIVSHISFKPTELIVNAKLWKKESITIVLNNKIQTTLEEVVVKALPITTKDDTTTYRIKAFTDGTEKTLEDVARKLPGIVVNDDGSMSFKGKRLNKILIEGEDLLSSKTKLLSKNFPADLLENVQLIENYNDNKVLKGFNQGDQTIMNLKLNQRKLKVAFGEIGGSLGIPKRHDYNVVIFSLLGKMKSATISNYNNIGKDNIQIAGLTVDSDEAIQKISNFNYQNIINLPQNIINPFINSLPLPTQRWFFNNQFNVSHQSNFNFSKRIRTKILLNSQSDDTRINYNRNSIFFQQNLNVNVKDSNLTNFKPLKLKLNVQNDFDISDKQQARLLFQFDMNNNVFSNNQRNNQLNIQSINNGVLKNNISSFFVLLDYAKRINENKILLVNNYLNTKNINQKYTLFSTTFSNSLINSGMYNPAIQNNLSPNFIVGSLLQLLLKSNNTVNSVYVDIQEQANKRNNFLVLKSTSLSDFIYRPSAQIVRNNVIALKLGYKSTWKQNKTKLINTIDIGYLSWINKSKNFDKTRDGFFWNIESTLQQKFNNKFSANIQSSFQRIYNNNHLLNDSFALVSNNELMRYVTTELFTTKFDISYSLFFISQKLLLASLNGGYSYQPNGFIATNNFSSTINFINNKFSNLSNSTNFLSIQIKMPILTLKSRIEFSGNLLYQTLPYYENQNEFLKFKNVNFNPELKYVTVLKTKINGEIGARYLLTKSNREQNNITLSTTKNISLINYSRVFYKYSKYNTISVFYNNYNLNINNQPLRIHFIDAEFNYSFNKSKILLEIILKNLLDNTTYNQFSITPLFQSNTNYFLFGRSIDVGLKVKL